MPKPAKKPEKDSKSGEQIVAQNRAASYNFHLLDRFEAGLVLHGTEVKALREGKANIRDAYVDFKPSGAWLVNAHIAQYLPGGPWNHEPLGSRKLLLHKNEIHKLSGRTESRGLTVILLCASTSVKVWRRSGNRPGARQKILGPPPGRTRQGSSQGNGKSYVQQPEALKKNANHSGTKALRSIGN